MRLTDVTPVVKAASVQGHGANPASLGLSHPSHAVSLVIRCRQAGHVMRDLSVVLYFRLSSFRPHAGLPFSFRW